MFFTFPCFNAYTIFDSSLFQLFCSGSFCNCAICFYLPISVSNTISVSDVCVIYHCYDMFWHVYQLHVLFILGTRCNVFYISVFKCLQHIRFVFSPICFVGAHGFIVLFVFIYVYRCQTQFPYQTYMLFTIVTIGATRGTGTAYPSETHKFSTVA
jgi:hypothetical protein